MPVSVEKRQQPMPVSAEKRQEEFLVLYEQAERSFFCFDTRLFEPGTLSLDSIEREGYEASEAFCWLFENGSIQAKYEAQT